MKTVLITGGSSGIGYEISKKFAQNGYKIIWVSLLEEEIQAAKKNLQKEFPSVEIQALTQDLSSPEAAQKTLDWIKSLDWSIDVLINNAGFATYGLSNTLSLDLEVNMIQLNVLSFFKMNRLFLDEMVAKDSGTIINISSSTAFQPVPTMAAYAASKAFVAQYSEGLNQELKNMQSKVRVITVYPAAIKDTKFKVTAKMEKVKTFEGLVVTTKKEVAQDVWNAFIKGKDRILTGKKLRLLRPLIKCLPNSILRLMIKRELSE